MQVSDLLFYAIAGVTLLGAAGVALSRHVIYAAFSLMAALLGVAGLYVFLAADFLAVVQLAIYVGGIVVLTIFAVMLTQRIEDVHVSNRAVGRLPALLVVVAIGAGLGPRLFAAPFVVGTPQPPQAMAEKLGHAFLDTYLLPFEVASVVLLAALVAATALARKELREP